MSFSVEQILEWTGGRLANADRLGGHASEIRVERPAELGRSKADEAAFFFSKDYQNEVMTAKCGIMLTAEPFWKGMQAAGIPLLSQSAIIVCADPYLAMAVLSEKFATLVSTAAHVPGRVTAEARDVHPTAVIDPTAELGQGVRIGPHCVIEAGAEVGDRTYLYSGVSVGPRVSIGADCAIFPNVAIYEWTQIGDRVRIHANTSIGSDGFGYAPVLKGGGGSHGVPPTSKEVEKHQKIYHLGRVVIGNDVEIGANCSVDRSTMGDTVIETMVKLDNQVHVGHNARIEEGAVVCGGTCLAGGAQIGRFAYVGGLTGITNRVRVGDGAQVGALALVTKDVEPRGTAVGNPQREYREHFKAHAVLNRLLKK